TATEADVAEVRVGDRELRIELGRPLVELLGLVERGGILVERARAHVEVVRRARAGTLTLGAEDADDLGAQVVDAEVEHHLTADGLEGAVLALDHDPATIAHDAELLERSSDAREGAAQRTDRLHHVA